MNIVQTLILFALCGLCGYFYWRWKQAAAVCLEMYVIMPCLLTESQLENEQVQLLLDNLMYAYLKHPDLIPFEPVPK